MTMAGRLENVSVILRSSGERSSGLCAGLIAREVPAAAFVEVSEVPFERTLRAAYQRGIELGAKWTVTVDADVLLLEGSIARLVAAAEAMPEHYIQLEGRIFDKVFGSYRQAGHRIYRTALLREALREIPEAGREIRPEFFVLQQMGRRGHPSRRIAEVVGLHDYEQYYLDLYRKAVVHARKHSWLAGELIQRCSGSLADDADFLVLLKGLWDGLSTSQEVSIDRRTLVDEGRRALEQLGLEEKAGIHDPQEFLKGFPALLSGELGKSAVPAFATQDDPAAVADSGWLAQVRQRYERGPVRGSAAVVGALLKRIGQYLDR